MGKYLALFLLLMGLVGCEPTEPVAPTVSVLTEAKTDDADQAFEKVTPDRQLIFPDDHGEHPTFKTEWWYLTANLTDDNGNEYGLQWTQFRIATSKSDNPGWGSPQIYMAHAVITTENSNQSAERFARGGIGQAGMTNSPYRIWLDNWVWEAEGDNPFPGKLHFADEAMAAELNITNQGELILHGDDGYSQKHPAEPRASYYYSAPFLSVDGKLTLNGESFKVSGTAWYDREWSSSMLANDQQGWDWFSIRLDDGSALMAAQIRAKDNKAYTFGSRSWPNGKVIPLKNGEIYLTPLSYSTTSGKTLPMKWRVDIPSQEIRLSVGVLRKEQWLPFTFPYWEGPISVTGSHQGRGFMELTGY